MPLLQNALLRARYGIGPKTFQVAKYRTDFPLVRRGKNIILRPERPGKNGLVPQSAAGKKCLRRGAPREKKAYAPERRGKNACIPLCYFSWRCVVTLSSLPQQ